MFNFIKADALLHFVNHLRCLPLTLPSPRWGEGRVRGSTFMKCIFETRHQLLIYIFFVMLRDVLNRFEEFQLKA
jgi:hypothetical protein